MLKEAIEKILSLAPVEEHTIGGRNYTERTLVEVRDPEPPVLVVNTLQGLVDYLRSGFDASEIGMIKHPDRPDTPLVALHIVSPKRVEVFQPISGPWKRRVTILQAQWSRTPFPFGDWLSQEDFVIKMQAMFQSSESWQPVMDVAGRIVCEDKAELHDDGVAQAATISRGIRKESGIVLPNPVSLKPVRTFTEVEQPESRFVFRMRSEPKIQLSLHEADMGAWEMAAKQNVKEFLEGSLPGVPVFM